MKAEDIRDVSICWMRLKADRRRYDGNKSKKRDEGDRLC